MPPRPMVFLAAASTIAGGYAGPTLARTNEAYPTKIIGVVRVGSLDSAVGKYGFATRSPLADKVFSACKMNDLCELDASVRDEQLVKVGKIIRIKEFVGPKDPLQWIYSHFRGDGGVFWLEDVDLGSLFTPRMTDLLVRSRRASEILEQESVGASPWVMAQDWDIRGFKIDVDEVEPGRAVGKVTFSNLAEEKPKPRSISFDVARTPDGWRIDEIRFPPEDGVPVSKKNRISEMLKIEIAEAEKEARDKDAKAAVSGSLCTLGEGEVFTCRAGAKQYSICTSGQKFEQPHSWIEYRSGTPLKPELVHRSAKAGTGGSFYGSFTAKGKGGLSYVRFAREGYDYVAYEDTSAQPARSGIVVRKGDRKVVEIPCNGAKDDGMPKGTGQMPSNLVVQVPFDDDLLK